MLIRLSGKLFIDLNYSVFGTDYPTRDVRRGKGGG